MSESAKWYVVHTYSGYENKVAQNIEKVVENRNLHDLIIEIRVPTEKVTEIKETKKGQEEREVDRKIFPSYVLIKMVLTDESWYVVRNTRGCTGFVGPGSKPIPLSDAEVAFLGVDVNKTVEVNFKEGDSITVINGSLEGFVGIVKSIDLEAKSVDVVVSMFGRETPATLELVQVKKLDEY